MSGSDLAVLIGAVVLLFAVGWFFFAPRKATHTTSEGDNQSIEIIVKGGYSPDTPGRYEGDSSVLPFYHWGNHEKFLRFWTSKGTSMAAAIQN